jgi:DNA-binding CsgD family transcriptional regulator
MHNVLRDHVVLTGQRSKPLKLVKLLDHQGKHTGKTAARPACDVVRQRRLSQSDHDDLLAAYARGVGTVELARQFKLHRDVVNKHLKRAGVLRVREALGKDQVREAKRLRADGQLYREIGERFGVHKDTVRRTLLRED